MLLYVNGVRDLNTDLRCRIAESSFFWDANAALPPTGSNYFSAAMVNRKGEVYFVPLNSNFVMRMTLLMQPEDEPDPRRIPLQLSPNYDSHAKAGKYSGGVLAKRQNIPSAFA